MAVVDKVDAWKYVAILDSGVIRDISMPAAGIAADEVSALAGEFLRSSYFRRRVGAHEPHAHYSGFGPGRRRRRSQRKYGLARRQEQIVAVAPGQELHAAISLSAVRLKAYGREP